MAVGWTCGDGVDAVLVYADLTLTHIVANCSIEQRGEEREQHGDYVCNHTAPVKQIGRGINTQAAQSHA
jgi:hypothetical protein